MSKFATKMFTKAQALKATRAMGTLEYVLIAAVVVVLAVLLRGTLTNVVSGLLGEVETNTNSGGGFGQG